MANVTIQTSNGIVKTLEANTPAHVAEELGMSMENVTLSVNGTKATPSTSLRDGDFVLFATTKVTSG